MDPLSISAESLSARVVNVHVSHDVLFSLPKMQKITAATLGRLGCEACHSGFDIRFLAFRDFIVHPESLEVTEQLLTGLQIR